MSCSCLQGAVLHQRQGGGCAGQEEAEGTSRMLLRPPGSNPMTLPREFRFIHSNKSWAPWSLQFSNGFRKWHVQYSSTACILYFPVEGWFYFAYFIFSSFICFWWRQFFPIFSPTPSKLYHRPFPADAQKFSQLIKPMLRIRFFWIRIRIRCRCRIQGFDGQKIAKKYSWTFFLSFWIKNYNLLSPRPP